MNKLSWVVLTGVLGFSSSMMAANSREALSPCDDGYHVYELDVCIANKSIYDDNEKKAIKITKKKLKDHYGLFDYLHIEDVDQSTKVGNFVVKAYTQEKIFKVSIEDWNVQEVFITPKRIPQ